MYQENDCFRLSRPLPDGSVSVGSVGVVLMVLCVDPPAYEVEFPDKHGRNFGASSTYTIGEEFMARWSKER